MEYVVIIRGAIEHGHQDTKAIGPLHTIERADEIRSLALEAGLDADVLILREQLDAEEIIAMMAWANA